MTSSRRCSSAKRLGSDRDRGETLPFPMAMLADNPNKASVGPRRHALGKAHRFRGDRRACRWNSLFLLLAPEAPRVRYHLKALARITPACCVHPRRAGANLRPRTMVMRSMPC